MDLQLWCLPASNYWFMISIDPEVSAIDIMNEVSEGMLNGHEFSDVRAVALLFRT